MASQYKGDRPGYIAKAKKWVEIYAKGGDGSKKKEEKKDTKPIVKEDSPLQKEAMMRVMELGFTEKDARKALETHKWDVEQAVNSLIK